VDSEEDHRVTLRYYFLTEDECRTEQDVIIHGDAARRYVEHCASRRRWGIDARLWIEAAKVLGWEGTDG
jgi:hypothetical protein